MGPGVEDSTEADVGGTIINKEQLDVKMPANDQHTAQDSADASPHGSPLLSPTDGDNEDDSSRPIAPLQKRRRVTRACDECRRKKIKCDGKQPCTHCTVYSYECTYDQPSNRRRNAPPQYVENLENQLKRANAILRLIVPNADLNDPDLENKLRQITFSPSPMQATPSTVNGTLPEEPESTQDDKLESMVQATGQLDLDEQGNFEYHGHSSGLHFVRRMRESLGDVMGPEPRSTPFIKSRPMSQVFDSPRSTSASPRDSQGNSDLPPLEMAREMCDTTINDAGALLRFVHYPSFVKRMERLYETPPEQYGNDENSFLPLFYAVLSVATLFAKDDGSGLEQTGYENAIAEGFVYFKQSRQLMDIADCRDLTQLQAVVFMILFLQSSAKLSVCYAYIGVALRSALRMGLHRSFTDNFNPIESETRKRLFWVIRKMDTYVGALLGLPHSLNDDEIDQDYPLEVDDEYITETRILPMPEGSISLLTASNHHTKLVQILAKVVKVIYPSHASIKRHMLGKNLNTYSVSYAKIVEIEQDLQNWQDSLPLALRPGGEATRVMQRCQHLLRMAYAHAQMMLYRPFLHYVSQTRDSKNVDKRSYACAAACVSVSRNIVNIAVEMQKRGLLGGAYWFTMYTTFFAILSLVFYALENPEDNSSQDVLKVAREAKETLESLARRSMAADRCAATLKALFQQLPDHKFKRTPSVRNTHKRRSSPSPSRELKQESQTHTPNLSSVPNPMQPQNFDLADLQYANAHGFYEPMATFSPSSQGPNTFTNSPTVPENYQPGLADLSAMMFPNPDPFAYPTNQPAGSDASFPAYKALDSSSYVPYSPSTAPNMRLHNLAGPHLNGSSSNSFVPPSSTFMMHSGGPDSRSMDNEGDVALLGPMPMYLMQGDSYINGTNTARPTTTTTNGTPITTTAQPVNGSGATVIPITTGGAQHEAHVAMRNKYFPTGAPGPMDLDALLGNEEWAGLPADRAPMYVSPAVGAPEGAFRRKQILHAQNGSPSALPVGQNGQGMGLQYDDLTPGMLGWGLEGF
ncbi:hypothetical protein BT63DRAFT_417543 [Microthyrium microscopicum]|uniref:Zn(2)-C6 fungal-type domain-containing protein n=1 Tax=Microthyrium microscopicum TaxID=703497 RepID=A0A6A6TZ77_9PEZI|nr:hypothetical protein BT63DRAFT_417543 [Microthyrium microscopicum]